VGWATDGGGTSGKGVVADFGAFVVGRRAGGGLVALGATDSRLERVEAAVTADCGGAADTTGDFRDSGGDEKVGEGSAGVPFRLAVFDCGFEAGFGVLGPAGARGT
jgi:hypothetical protein